MINLAFKKTKKILAIVFLGVLIFLPILSFAQGGSGQPNPGGSGQTPAPQLIVIENPFRQNTIRGLIETLINDILVPIGAVVAVLMVMYAGFLYVTARGNPAQIEKAHDALLWAVIGAAILLGAWVISEAIQSTIDQLEA